jgi:hypothetical protein
MVPLKSYFERLPTCMKCLDRDPMSTPSPCGICPLGPKSISSLMNAWRLILTPISAPVPFSVLNPVKMENCGYVHACIRENENENETASHIDTYVHVLLSTPRCIFTFATTGMLPRKSHRLSLWRMGRDNRRAVHPRLVHYDGLS